ncbi:MAG: aspartate-semialdehyde dehydrogenase [Synergistetes bacterium]|nr:aspartate-semialdehyde dehydrogenase [Synergistota bacterium]MCX8127668.1 aspartate-semialdehyde dehydrogenase [Synergistota bacterium]MDW8191417.1 aspartate-semialdehyde dehydrogenase [Synergistota bacterium]
MYSISVVGATGAVGREILKVLEERSFPVKELYLFASEKSEGTELTFMGERVKVKALSEENLKSIKTDFTFFSAGTSISQKFAPIAASTGSVVIDNSRAFRYEDWVPLVVPEVNPRAAFKHKGIIANPNCSTIQMVVALKPLHDYARVKRVVVTTFQSVSGAGWRAVLELQNQIKNPDEPSYVIPKKIAYNVVPQIDVFLEDLYTREEDKMRRETIKIMEDPFIKVTATTVRVPVIRGHSESINIEFEREISVEKARELLKNAPGVILMDDPKNGVYPTALDVDGKDEVFVGRIRKDETIEHGLNMWVVADNLRKGAATNAVQIAQLLIKGG